MFVSLNPKIDVRWVIKHSGTSFGLRCFPANTFAGECIFSQDQDICYVRFVLTRRPRKLDGHLSTLADKLLLFD